MKKVGVLFLAVIFAAGCNNLREPKSPIMAQTQEVDFSAYTSAGEKISGENALTTLQMQERFEQLAIGDTLDVKFLAEVASVCKKKGCWMNLEMKDGEETVVKFKDYEFFVPKDIEDKQVVVNGKAFISIVSVEEQRHLAEDGGGTPEEIAAITEPRRTLSFLADGVLIEP